MTAKISVLMFTYHTQAHRRLQWLPEAVESILAWRSMEEEFRWKVSYTRNLTQEQRDDLIQQFHALKDIR